MQLASSLSTYHLTPSTSAVGLLTARAQGLGKRCPRMLHTGMLSEALPAPDDAEQLRQFKEVCRRDLASLSGLQGSRIGRTLLQTVLSRQLRLFADNMATFNLELVTLGLAEAATALCRRYGGCVVAEGLQHVPRSGPLLLVSNHPGMFDTLGIYATLPRSDIRALARPQPLLGLMSSLAPNLLMLPDEGAGRAGGLRQVLQLLRADGALLIYPAGHLEPEPMLMGRHGLKDGEPREPLGPWSNGVGTLVKLAARQGVPLKVVPTSLSGVLSLSTWRWFGPLLKLRKTLRGREDLTAVLQVAFPGVGPTTIQVRYGAPLDAAQLAAGDADVEAITARVRAAVHDQIRQSLRTL
jgi:1-acyl-sn-glycerol-3-phosphate acyltransferase